MNSLQELQQLAQAYCLQCHAISDEIAPTVALEKDRHFRYGKYLALFMLADGFSQSAISESFHRRQIRNSKLSKNEGWEIFRRATKAAATEWDNRGA